MSHDPVRKEMGQTNMILCSKKWGRSVAGVAAKS